MQDLCKKDSALSSAHSTSPIFLGSTSRCSSTDPHVQQSSLSQTLSLKMGHSPQHLGLKFQDQDSPSTQSTGQSYPEMASMGGRNPYGQSIFTAQSGYNQMHGRPVEGHMKSASLMGTQDFVFSPLVNYSQPNTCIPVVYPEPYVNGLLPTGNVTQAMIHHSQLMGMSPAQVPLPLDQSRNFMNPKQYPGIIRRRQQRAKLEAQNKLSKDRKPYLHESRHRHALKRPRGSGGRFLNAKKLQESKPTPTTDGVGISNSSQLHRTGNVSESEVYQLENHQDGTSTPSCSDVTSASNSDDMFQQPEYGFPSRSSHIGSNLQGGRNQQYHFSVLRQDMRQQ